MRLLLLTMWAWFSVADANYPVFEAAGQLKQLLVPAEVHIGSVIYRLRASDSDHDYPLQFDATDYGSYVVKVENLPCNVNSTYCEANVYLERVLMVGQVFKFRFTVRDTKGDTTTASVSIEVTDAPVDITNIFPHLPGIIILPENTKPGTELEYVIVRRHPEHKKPAVLEIRGSNVIDFGRMRSSQETTTGVITLKRGLDFETQNMYKLQIFALDMYTDKQVDSRNIAGFEIILIVEDVQDTPPIFINTEPTTKLRSNLTQGDFITKVTAIDGDRGNPRQINYGIVSENNPFTIFFNIDRLTGQITLAKPLKQLTAIARSHQPILLTIMAEEQRANIKEPPAMSTTATIALLLAEAGNTPPYFDNDHYVCHLDENSPQGAALVFSDAYSTQVHDDDMGKQGVFSLILEKNNGTFEISPNIVERKASFTVRVRNNLLLDYDSRKSVEFVIVARELDPGSLSSSVTVLVYLNDVNDNPPQFERTVYMAQIPENATANAYIAEVRATDVDTGLFGRVHYTRILGFRNSSLLLNSVTGVITVASDNHGFDREEASEYHLTVEARDMEGAGQLATVPIIIRVLDVNDETPIFENAPFHFTMTPDAKNFSARAFVRATDKDAEPPNNIVRYEIISGNYNNKFTLNSETGELTVRYSVDGLGQIRKRRQTTVGSISGATLNMYTLTIRAYDLGVPHRWSTAQVRIFPPETGTRLLTFVMPSKGLDYGQAEELLMRMTGGHVTIVEIKPYRGSRYVRAVADDKKGSSKEKSVVVARVNYGDNSVVDIEQVYYMMQHIYRNTEVESNQLQNQPAEASTGTYWVWILLFLMLFLLALLIALLLCYLSKCHPCYTLFGEKKKNQVSDAAQTVNQSNKSVQANNNHHHHQHQQHRRLEIRSSTDSGYRNRWKFYRHREPDPQPVFLIPKSISPAHYRKPTTMNDEMPAFVYRTDISSMDRHAGDVFVQDIADSEYHILDPAKLNVQRISEPETTVARTKKYTNSKNQHERARRQVSGEPREETFVREGQAEILRLQTNDESVTEEQLLHQPDKSYYNHFDTNNTSQTNSSHADPPTKPFDIHQNGAITQIEYILPRKQPSAEDEQRDKPKLHRAKRVDAEESTAHVIEPAIQEVQMIDIQSIQPPSGFFEATPRSPDTLPATDAADATAKLISEKITNSVSKIGISNYLHNSAAKAAAQTTDAQAAPASEPEMRTILDVAHLEEERHRLTSFQRDILLTRFLVEENRHLWTQTVDTQSLPGSLSMATQTDRHRSTQTDLLCLMRPEPRKVKSENDDSSDSEADCGKKGSYRRCYSVIGKDKARYKLRTPIMEETESVEGVKSRNSSSQHRPNKSSILRTANNRSKINSREATAQAKSKLDLKHAKSKYKSSNDLRNHHVSLCDVKKSVSYTDINDSRTVLSDKEMYTPRSLKSRIIARRLSASEPPKPGAHSRRQDYKQQRSNTYEKESHFEPCKKCELRRNEGVKKPKCKHTPAVAPIVKAKSLDQKNSSSGSNTSGANEAKSPTVDNPETTQTSPPISATSTLKLKSKNQQLMEKKSVFTIAYDDAATQHLGNSSNGSVQEQE